MTDLRRPRRGQDGAHRLLRDPARVAARSTPVQRPRVPRPRQSSRDRPLSRRGVARFGDALRLHRQTDFTASRTQLLAGAVRHRSDVTLMAGDRIAAREPLINAPRDAEFPHGKRARPHGQFAGRGRHHPSISRSLSSSRLVPPLLAGKLGWRKTDGTGGAEERRDTGEAGAAIRHSPESNHGLQAATDGACGLPASR